MSTKSKFIRISVFTSLHFISTDGGSRAPKIKALTVNNFTNYLKQLNNWFLGNMGKVIGDRAIASIQDQYSWNIPLLELIPRY